MPDRADAAQRKLAAIWKARHPDVDDRQAPASDVQPEREPNNELLTRLSAELDERSQTLGADDPETISTQLELAGAHLEAGGTAEAIALFEQGIAAIDPEDPSAAIKRAAATAALANAYLTARLPQRAIALYQSLLADGAGTRSELLGYRIRLAVAHRATGDATATVDQLQSLCTELADDGAEEHWLLQARVELATTMVVAGRAHDAVALFENALLLANDVHGAGDHTALGIRLLLARAHQQAGQSNEAIRVYEELARDAEQALGPDHLLTVQSRNELAVLLLIGG